MLELSRQQTSTTHAVEFGQSISLPLVFFDLETHANEVKGEG